LENIKDKIKNVINNIGNRIPGRNRNGYDDIRIELDVYKRNKRMRVIIILAMVAVVLLGCFIYQKTRTFSKYKVISSVDIQNGEDSDYLKYGDLLVKYSVDGISYIDGNKTVWNQAFEMKDPLIDSCGEYVAIADENGTEIYLFDEDGLVNTIDASYPIIRLEVASQGVVAAILEDSNTNYIELMDKDGEQLVASKTNLASNGYPLDFSISEDGTKMVVSYLYVSGGVMQSKVLFYNFSDVGQNEVDRMVGGFNQYASTIVPEVSFLTNDTAVAIGDNMFTIYSMKQKPEIIYETEFTDEIKQLFTSEDYVGFVFYNTDEQHSEQYKICVYNLKGKIVMSEYVNEVYDNIKLVGKNILTYNEKQCMLMTFSGKQKFEYDFKEDVVEILPISAKSYLFVTNNEIQRVKLK
jgi:hypothetical protein